MQTNSVQNLLTIIARLAQKHLSLTVDPENNNGKIVVNLIISIQKFRNKMAFRMNIWKLLVSLDIKQPPHFICLGIHRDRIIFANQNRLFPIKGNGVVVSTLIIVRRKMLVT